jgi:hypothetical protein
LSNQQLNEVSSISSPAISPAIDTAKVVGSPVSENIGVCAHNISIGKKPETGTLSLESPIWRCSDCSEEFYYYPLVCDCGCPDFVEVI